MKKRILSGFLALCLVVCAVVFPSTAASRTYEKNGYFKNQISSEERVFYEALEKLEETGGLQTGTGSHELDFTNSQLKAYADGDPKLAQNFQAARDAFSQDRCDLFYVDFSKLTFRVGLKNDGNYAAFLNNGPYESYLCAPFNTKDEVEAALNAAVAKKEEIIKGVKEKLTLGDDDFAAHAEQIVTEVHNQLAERITFTYPSGNDSENVHGVYGALVNGTGNCEGYSRSMKWILDDFDIPCVLVTGIGQNSKEVSELHMWNAVQIGGNWYGVDVTWDDPVNADSVRDLYLLRGSTVLHANHFENGLLSSGSKEFTYPKLSELDYADVREGGRVEDASDENNSLKVTTESAIDKDGDQYTNYMITYDDKNIGQAFSAGKNVAMRFMYPGTKIEEEPTSSANEKKSSASSLKPSEELEEEEVTDSSEEFEEEEVTDSSEETEEEEVTDSSEEIEEEELTDSSQEIEEEELTDSSEEIEEEELTDSSEEIEEEELTDSSEVSEEEESTEPSEEKESTDLSKEIEEEELTESSEEFEEDESVEEESAESPEESAEEESTEPSEESAEEESTEQSEESAEEESTEPSEESAEEESTEEESTEEESTDTSKENPPDIEQSQQITQAERIQRELPPGTVKQIEIDGQYWNVGPWFSLNGFSIVHMKEYSVVSVFKQSRIQFCVTELKPETEDGDYLVELEDEDKHLALTKPLLTPYYSNYQAPPFIHTSEPELTRRILAKEGESYDYTVTYNDVLEKVDAEEDVSISVTCSEPGVTGYKVEDVTIKESSYTVAGITKPCTVVKFKFTPSMTFQGYINVYTLQPENLVGKNSGKPPKPIPICSTLDMRVPCPSQTSPGGPGNAFVIAMPTLIVNEEMDVFDTTNLPSKSPLDIRLVASIPGEEETEDLLNVLKESGKVPGGITGKTATYDLSLGCGNVVARLGQGNYNVTIGLPYPEGFNYEENKDVIFKAYHYKKDSDGSYIVEELVCQITPQGLIVIANDFSPFTIVQLASGVPVQDPTYKLVNVSMDSVTGGNIYETDTTISACGLHPLNEGGSRSFVIRPETGYEIERILLNGKILVLSDEQKRGYTHTFEFTKMQKENNLQASFIATSVKELEKVSGFVPVPAPQTPTIPPTPEPTPPPTPEPTIPPTPEPTPPPTPAPNPTSPDSGSGGGSDDSDYSSSTRRVQLASKQETTPIASVVSSEPPETVPALAEPAPAPKVPIQPESAVSSVEETSESEAESVAETEEETQIEESSAATEQPVTQETHESQPALPEDLIRKRTPILPWVLGGVVIAAAGAGFVLYQMKKR